MKQKRHNVEEVIAKLRQADVDLGKGKNVPEAIGITEQTYYRWRQKYGSMRPAVFFRLRLSPSLQNTPIPSTGFSHCT